MTTVKLSEVNFTDAARELAELFLEGTDYRVFYPNYKSSPRVSYLYLSDGENYIIAGKSTIVPWDWYATFPIKPSRDYGSGIILPTDTMEEIASAEEVVEVTKRYMGPSLTPGPRHCEGAYGTKAFANYEKHNVEMIEIVR